MTRRERNGSARLLLAGATLGLVVSELAFDTASDLWCTVRLSLGFVC